MIKRSGFAAAALLLLAPLAACTASNGSVGGADPNANPAGDGAGDFTGSGDTSEAPLGAGGSDSSGVGTSDGSSDGSSIIPGGDSSDGSDDGSGAGDGSSGSASDVDGSTGSDGSALGCEVQQIMQDSCYTCHGNEPQFGAPMPLVAVEDFQQMTVDGQATVGERMLERVQADTQRMPPPPNPSLPSDQVATLTQWVEGGMTSFGCDSSTGGDDLSGGAAGAGGSDADPIDPDPVDSGEPELPSMDECDYVMDVVAHGRSGTSPDEDTSGFAIPTAVTTYQCFYQRVPWSGTEVHGLSFEPILDNTDIIHHFVLGVESSSSSRDGAHAPCSSPPGATVGTWAPGVDPLVMPPDVGMEMPSGSSSSAVLQIHYNNPSRESGHRDRSGFRICATTALKTNTAAIHWLGVDFGISPDSQGRDGSSCAAQERTHILSVGPHMHLRGRHFKIEVERSDGSTDVVWDEPFDFYDQPHYPCSAEGCYANNPDVTSNPLWVEAGERIRTTCTWDMSMGPVAFGTASSDEMCYNYVLAYPAGSLSDGGGLIGALSEYYMCTQGR